MRPARRCRSLNRSSFKPPIKPFDTEPAVAAYKNDIRAVSSTADVNNPHVEGAYVGMQNVQVTYLIDPDTRTFAAKEKTVQGRGNNRPRCVQDVREALQDRNLDAPSPSPARARTGTAGTCTARRWCREPTLPLLTHRDQGW